MSFVDILVLILLMCLMVVGRTGGSPKHDAYMSLIAFNEVLGVARSRAPGSSDGLTVVVSPVGRATLAVVYDNRPDGNVPGPERGRGILRAPISMQSQRTFAITVDRNGRAAAVVPWPGWVAGSETPCSTVALSAGAANDTVNGTLSCPDATVSTP